MEQGQLRSGFGRRIRALDQFLVGEFARRAEPAEKVVVFVGARIAGTIGRGDLLNIGFHQGRKLFYAVQERALPGHNAIQEAIHCGIRRLRLRLRNARRTEKANNCGFHKESPNTLAERRCEPGRWSPPECPAAGPGGSGSPAPPRPPLRPGRARARGLRATPAPAQRLGTALREALRLRWRPGGLLRCTPAWAFPESRPGWSPEPRLY